MTHEQEARELPDGPKTKTRYELIRERDEARAEVATLTAQRDKAQARIDELLCLQAEERVFARAAIDEAKDAADQYKSQRDKAVDALRTLFAVPGFTYEHLRQAAAVLKEIEQSELTKTPQTPTQ